MTGLPMTPKNLRHLLLPLAALTLQACTHAPAPETSTPSTVPRDPSAAVAPTQSPRPLPPPPPPLPLQACPHAPAPETSTPSTVARAPSAAVAPTQSPDPPPDLLPPATVPAPAADAISRIRDEGMNRSQVMQTLSY